MPERAHQARRREQCIPGRQYRRLAQPVGEPPGGKRHDRADGVHADVEADRGEHRGMLAGLELDHLGGSERHEGRGEVGDAEDADGH